MKLQRITFSQFEDRMNYLEYVAGPELEDAIKKAARTDDKNQAKVIDLLQQHQKWAGECAKYLQDQAALRIKGEDQ